MNPPGASDPTAAGTTVRADPLGPFGSFVRGTDDEDGNGRRIVRTLPGLANATALDRLQDDARWSAELGPEIALQPERLEPGGSSPRLVLCSAGLERLHLLLRFPLPVDRTLRLGVILARLLARMHARGVVHGSLHPDLVWTDEDLHEARVAALDLSFTDAGLNPRPPRWSYTQDLRYLAPELSTPGTPVDRRADLYALGVLLYEAATGSLPFRGHDAIGIHHAHSAVAAEPLSNLRPDLPSSFSRLVATLLAKDPDERYQSATGAGRDLASILAAVEDGRGDPVELRGQAVRDLPLRPRILVGRQPEIRALDGMFRSRKPGAFGLVGGPSGAGKSALVEHAIRGISPPWIVGTGKSDQFRHREPYQTLKQPLEIVLREIAASGEDELRAFAENASRRFGDTAGTLRTILPGLERFVPAGPPDPSLSAHAAEVRVKAAFLGLLSTLGSLPHPVVLVIDDLQWADPASVAILSSIASSASPPPVHFLFTFRDDEIAAGTELAQTISAVRTHPALAADLLLGPLLADDVLALVSESLGVPGEDVRPLADRLFLHSQGNAMFAVEELLELGRLGKLHRDPPTGDWRWSDSDLPAIAHSQQLSALMSARVRRLPVKTRGLLAQAACFGPVFDARSLAALNPVPGDDLATLLLAARHEGVLFPDDADPDGNRWRFPHDQIQLAACALLDDEEREAVHLAIGMGLLDAGDGTADGGLTRAISHLNAAAGLLQREGRARWLAAQNLAAARDLVARSAFADAHACLHGALGLLDDAAWTEDRPLAWEFHVEAARAACLSNAASQALELVEELRRRSRSEEEEVLALEIAIEAYKVLDRFPEAIAAGCEALDRLDVRLPRRPSMLLCLVQLARTHRRMLRGGASRLSRLPRMHDVRASAAMRILADLGTPSFLVMPTLFLAIVDAQLRLSLSFGNAPESPYAYALYAIMLVGPFGRIEKGHEVGLAALQVLETTGRLQAPRTRMAAFVFVMPWKTALPDCLGAYLDGFDRSLESGDPEFANYHASAYAAFSVHAGANLATACAHLDRMRELVLPLGQQRQYAADIYHQTMRNLRTAEGDPAVLAGAVYNEALHGAAHAGAMEMNGHRALCRLMLAVLFDRPERHDELIRDFRLSAKAFDGMYVRAAFFFYEALALLRFDGGSRARWRTRQAIARFRSWQRHCPANFRHKEKILRAELAARAGDPERAQALFAKAAALAEQAGFHLEAGLAFEGACNAALAAGLAGLAHHFCDEARRVYSQWGAEAKVRDLDIRFGKRADSSPEGLPGEAGAARGNRAAAGPAWNIAPASLDLVGVLAASQALSEGMELDATIHRILHTIASIAGAQRGALLVGEAGTWRILATAETKGDTLEVEVHPDGLPHDSAVRPSWFAARVVDDVDRAGSPLILSDPDSDPVFRADPHLQRWKPRSLLCCPIRHGDARRAIVYLEHGLRRDAFGVRQMEAIRLLSTQAAISLDNARLYARQLKLSAGAHRFVPAEFLQILGKTDVDQVALSDHVEAEMTILVCDIRGFSSTTETMTPEASFAFINEFFAMVGPAVRAHDGFIMKYMGDGFMALFPRNPDDAARTALAIPGLLAGRPDLRVGIGLHTGTVAVGAVGEASRLQGDVMSDVANVACRLESLTREHPATILMSARTHELLSGPYRNRSRALGEVAVKGRAGTVAVHAME